MWYVQNYQHHIELIAYSVKWLRCYNVVFHVKRIIGQ